MQWENIFFFKLFLMFHIVSAEHGVDIFPTTATSLFWMAVDTLEPITDTVRVVFPWYTTFSAPILSVTWQSYIIKTLVPIFWKKDNV